MALADPVSPGGIRSLLADRRFRALWASQIVTQVGGNALLYALTVAISKSTESATALGLLFWAFLGPTILAAMPAGLWVDRTDPRRILVGANAMRALLVGLIAAVLVTGAPLPLVYALVIPVAVATALFAPAELAMIPRLVRPGELMAANGLFTLTLQAAFPIGLVVVGVPAVALGPGFLAALIGAGYLAAAIACARLPSFPAADPDERPLLLAARGELAEALAAIRALPPVRAALGRLFVSGALVGALGVLGPGYAAILGLPEEVYGLAILPVGGGVALAAFVLGRLGPRLGPARAGDAGVALLALGLAGLAGASMAGLVGLALAGGALAGAGYAALAIPSQAALGHETPESARGRIFGTLNLLFSLAAVAPTVLIAPLADLAGIEPVLWLLALALGLRALGTLARRPRAPA